MTDTPPDRLSANPGNPFYDAAALDRGVGVRFKGVEKTNVDEYCVSEGWVRLTAGGRQGPQGQRHDREAAGPGGALLPRRGAPARTEDVTRSGDLEDRRAA